jgi:phosphatidate cytidylyltransferase
LQNYPIYKQETKRLGGIDLKRVISSLVVLPPLIILLVYGSKGWFFLLLLIINILALSEFFGLPTFSNDKWFKTLSILFGSLILSAAYFWGMSGLTGFFLLALLALFLFSVYHLDDLNKAVPKLGVGMLGVVYISCLLSYFILLRDSDVGMLLVLFLLAVVWSTDTSAYYIGKNFGKTKLLPLVSPNKTVEGAIGGLAGGLIASVAFKIFFFSSLTVFDAFFLPLILSATSQMGDLFESFIKRWAGVKDMGSLIPGHGGMLDRIDGLLFAAPVLYFYSF